MGNMEAPSLSGFNVPEGMVLHLIECPKLNVTPSKEAKSGV